MFSRASVFPQGRVLPCSLPWTHPVWTHHPRIRQDTVNRRSVRILLEYILVTMVYCTNNTNKKNIVPLFFPSPLTFAEYERTLRLCTYSRWFSARTPSLIFNQKQYVFLQTSLSAKSHASINTGFTYIIFPSFCSYCSMNVMNHLEENSCGIPCPFTRKLSFSVKDTRRILFTATRNIHADK